MPFPQRINQPPQKKEKDNCKIKIKKTKTGREIHFEGKCSKEEIQIAKEHLESND